MFLTVTLLKFSSHRVMREASVNNTVEVNIKQSFFNYAHLCRSVNCNKRYDGEGVLKLHQDHVFISCSNSSNIEQRSIQNNFGYSRETSTTALTWPAVGLTLTTNLSIARPRLRETHYAHSQLSEFSWQMRLSELRCLRHPNGKPIKDWLWAWFDQLLHLHQVNQEVSDIQTESSLEAAYEPGLTSICIALMVLKKKEGMQLEQQRSPTPNTPITNTGCHINDCLKLLLPRRHPPQSPTRRSWLLAQQSQE